MSIFRTLCILSLITVFGSVVFGQKVTSTFDEDYSLSKLSVYEFKAEERKESDPLATDTVTEKKIKEALDDELKLNGYFPPSDGESPDFLIAFHVKTQDKTDERGKDNNYIQGILIVDFYDAKTKKLIWRGIASTAVGSEMVDLKLAEEKINGAVKLLLEQFSKDRLGFQRVYRT